MKIELKDYTVEIKDEMTWGDSQKIQETILSAAKMKGSGSSDMNIDFDGSSLTIAKYTTLELMVRIITDKEGKVTAYSKEWVNNLSVSDGDKLYEAVEEVTKKK